MKANGTESRSEESPDPVETPGYDPPAIEWEEPLGTVARFAAACGRLPLGDLQCEVNPATS